VHGTAQVAREEPSLAGAARRPAPGGGPPGAGAPAGPRVHQLLERAAAGQPGAPAITSAGQTWTYRRLAAESARLAGWLAAHQVGPGDRVILAARSGPHAVALMYACSWRNAVFVPLPESMRPFQLRALIGDTEPAIVIVSGPQAARSLGPVPAPVTDLGRLVDELASCPAGPPGTTDSGAETTVPAFLLFTSGSSAMPKGVICPHASVLFAAQAIAGRLGYRAGDVIYCRLPFSFDYGLYQALLAALAGCELVLDSGSAALGLLPAMHASGATVVPLVPPLAAILARLAGRQPVPGRIRLFTNTGAALGRAVAADLRQRFPGAQLCLMYGLTECKRATIMPPDEHLRRPASAGLPLPGTTIRVVAPDGRAQPPGRPGEIVVEGRHVMAGYWRDPGRTAERFRASHRAGERQLSTGDLGYTDPEGYLYVLGRLDDTFSRRGVRMSCQEIEHAALDIPGISQAAVVPATGSHDMALFVAGALRPDQVLRALADRLSADKCPPHCQVLTALPVTPHGKPDRRALARRAAAQ
jgi:acyl-CoA synthetase (AMP-forming)/AMP-acid ligase II